MYNQSHDFLSDPFRYMTELLAWINESDFGQTWNFSVNENDETQQVQPTNHFEYCMCDLQIK